MARQPTPIKPPERDCARCRFWSVVPKSCQMAPGGAPVLGGSGGCESGAGHRGLLARFHRAGRAPAHICGWRGDDGPESRAAMTHREDRNPR